MPPHVFSKKFGISIAIFLVLVFFGWWFLANEARRIESEQPINPPIVAENPDGEADPNRMKLDMTTWNWISTRYNNGKTIEPRKNVFTLTFDNNGSFSATTDCNSIGGKYEVKADKQITFSEMMSTLMFCADSQETEYKKILENTASYFFTGRGELILELKFDSGTATFR